MVESGHSHHHVRTVASAEDYPLERLLDPCNDRKCPDVPRPPRYPMNIENLFVTVDGKQWPPSAEKRPGIINSHDVEDVLVAEMPLRKHKAISAVEL